MKANNAGLDWVVDSAGTNRFHTGEPPHPLSQKIALLNGIDISGQRARTFVKADLAEYDRIYALANDVLLDMKEIAGEHSLGGKVDLLMNQLFPGKNRDVPDPWSGPESGYHKAFEMMDQACETIVQNYLINQQTEKIQ